jgi:hypothetical protein
MERAAGRSKTPAVNFLPSSSRASSRPAYLYRHYHPSGDLLYVGVSIVPVGRQLTHFKRAGWHYAIHQIVVEPFATREEALGAERLAIETEFPKGCTRPSWMVPI